VRDFILANVAADEIFALSRCLAAGSSDAAPNEFHRHFAILENAGYPVGDVRVLLPTLPRRPGPKSGRVVLAPFSSAPIKDWPDRAWSELIPRLADRGYHFEAWVGPGQLDRAEALGRQIRIRAPEVPFTTRTGGLADLAEAVNSAALVLTVDTFTAHLGAAMDVPSVCLIGGGHYGDFGPWRRSSQQQWVTNLLPCFGCNWICSRPRVECIEDIGPTVVLEAIEKALAAE
jgi:ADP-heptose:LPS heptosyltransferase